VPTPLVEHGSSWSSQDAHPHPVFDPGGRSVLFTSDRAGVRAVYRVEAGP
jgi:Tol biopolymer transport system component